MQARRIRWHGEYLRLRKLARLTVIRISPDGRGAARARHIQRVVRRKGECPRRSLGVDVTHRVSSVRAESHQMISVLGRVRVRVRVRHEQAERIVECQATRRVFANVRVPSAKPSFP